MCLLAVRLPVNTIALIMYGGFAGTLLLLAFTHLPSPPFKFTGECRHSAHGFYYGFIPLFLHLW